jgi:hypothetical protein
MSMRRPRPRWFQGGAAGSNHFTFEQIGQINLWGHGLLSISAFSVQSFRNCSLPSRRRRGADHAVSVVVILSGDFEIEPFIQLGERQLRLVLRLITAARRRRRVRAARQKMDLSHHGADEPFNVASESG